jgi:hypothetical protein
MEFSFFIKFITRLYKIQRWFLSLERNSDSKMTPKGRIVTEIFIATYFRTLADFGVTFIT